MSEFDTLSIYTKLNNDKKNSMGNALFPVYSLYDLEPVKGEGCYIYDTKGTRILDFYGGHAVISIGHSHPHYVDKISQQLKKIGFYSNSVQNPLAVELAEKLIRLSGCNDYRLFLCNSGAEANENALKLASFATGRRKILAFEKGFHGRTSAAVNVTDNPKIQAPINKTFEVEFHAWLDMQSIEESIGKGDVCAVILEGIQGIGGIHVTNASFLLQLAECCKAHGVLLILDEVQSGYGRSGCFFGYQPAPIQPDIITLAKGMGNGFPIGGVLIHPKLEAWKGMLGSTFGGNHLACAAGIAVLDVIQSENLMANARAMGRYLITQLQDIKHIKNIRGRGLMIGLEMNRPVAGLRKKLLFEEQVFTGSSSDPNTLRLLPPLTIESTQVDYFIEKLKKVLHTELW